MKIITWNVNSVRARLPRVLALLERHRPDLLCLQETKVVDEAFPAAALAGHGWHAEVHGQKTYNGVALIGRAGIALEQVQRGFPRDPAPQQTRAISAALGGLRVVDLYVVNGQAVGGEKYDLKLRWLDALAGWLRQDHDPAQPLLLLGDFNIAPDDRDVHDPALWRGRLLCSDAERERLRTLQDWGLSDLLRLHTAEGGVHTWWDYRAGAFARGLGLRIDLALGTRPVAERCLAVEVDREERKKSSGEGSPSDHAPVIVTLRDGPW